MADSFVKNHSYILNENSYSLLHSNIRSAAKNLDKLDNYLNVLNTKFSVIGLSETWFSDSTASLYDIQGYEKIDNYRKEKRGGGVSLLINDCLDYSRRKDLDVVTDDVESIFIEIEKKEVSSDKHLIIGVIYRPPNTNLDNFLGYLEPLLEKIKNENKHCYLLGDFNLNLLNIDKHTKTGEFVDLMFSYHLVPLIDKPTRVRETSATLIDNIFTNNITVESSQGLFYTDLTDHFPVFYCCPSLSIESSPKYITKRVYSENNINKFVNLIQACNWNAVTDLNDPQLAYDLFHDTFHNAYELSFPMKTFKLNYRNKKTWLTTGLKNSIKKKNGLYVKHKRYPTRNTELIYKQYKKYLSQILYRAEREQYDNLFQSYKSNMKKSWELIAEIINKKSNKRTKSNFLSKEGLPLSGKDVATNFNNFFVNVGPTLAGQIPESQVDPLSYMNSRNAHTIFLQPVTFDEVSKIIKELRNSSPGWDDIHAKIVKKTYLHFVTPLTHVCNLSISRGCFPSQLKVAKVIPLHKADSTSVYTNYRPVSVLTCFSKVFEILMYDRLISFVIKHSLLYKYQFGFRKDHSTIFAILSLVDFISKALEKGEYVIGIFLDFSKAFDTVNHNILFRKLENIGIRGVAYDWIFDYLRNRQQYVVYDGHQSEYKTVTCGVPQGSVLGPLLFLLYINDIANVSTYLFSILFADDTNSLASGKDLPSLISSVNEELQKVVTWLASNKLSLNIKKTHFMLFCSKGKKIAGPVSIKISNQEIARVDHTKFLGVIIDEKLNWSNHINSVKRKVAKGIGIICKAKRWLTQNTLSTLYYSFIYPYMQYGVLAWGYTYKSYLDPLIKMQKRAVRLIALAARNDHTGPIFRKLNMLNLSNIYVLNVMMFMYKNHHGLLPVFEEMFNTNCEFHGHYTRQSNKIHVPSWHLEVMRRSIRVQGTRLWNLLSNKVDYNCTLVTYKYNMKRYLHDCEIEFL